MLQRLQSSYHTIGSVNGKKKNGNTMKGEAGMRGWGAGMGGRGVLAVINIGP